MYYTGNYQDINLSDVI